MTPQERAQSVTDLLSQLIDVLEQENKLLMAPRSTELGPLVERKQALLADYEQELKAIGKIDKFSTAIEPEIRDTLKSLSERFQRVSAENERRLKISVRASSMIVERIRDAATRAAGAKVSSYGNTGARHAEARKAAPVAINETL